MEITSNNNVFGVNVEIMNIAASTNKRLTQQVMGWKFAS